jgi:pilus assembly protein Flp/PilA
MEGIKRFMRRASDRGASLVEYALLVALIAVVCIAAVTQLGGATADAHQEAADGVGGDDGCGWLAQHGYPDVHRGDLSHGNGESSNLCYDDERHYVVGTVHGG